ncbi:DUF6650 family protein [Arthrobacter sp.]|uniref:DUF6650 family protein n=1 Tax=Arthrobacter sp. TaxID=1667 RepID=UPI00258AFE14|nr:DUF6650 family protein [Arthrobacter sp.]
MGLEITGVSFPVGGIQWQRTPGDRKLARRVLTFLEDRRVIFGGRHLGDEEHCVLSALEIRDFLTEQIAVAHPGKEFETCLRTIRAACRDFVDAGGPNGRYFTESDSTQIAIEFGLALGDLRTSIGYQLAIILDQYPFHIEPQLAAILPPSDDDATDLNWIADFS